MNLPDFLIIGAAKSGTSSLWTYLNQHPEVFLSRNKEPNFFALSGKQLPEPGPATPEVLHKFLYSYTVTEPADYSALFAAANGAKAVGEASVRYLYTPGTADRIHAAVPGVRLIVMLRDPVRRLYSHYCMNRQYGFEPLPLLEAVRAEPGRRADGWGYDWQYTGVSRYAEQLNNYFRLFPREQIKVFLFEDFAKDTVGVVGEICRFLEVDDSFVPDVSLRKKESYRPRSRTLDNWVNPPGWDGVNVRARRLSFLPNPIRRRVFSGINRLNRGAVPPLPEEDRLRLRKMLADDIAETAQLLGREPGW